ncbi:DUF3168 domain-containing protein [Bradyrhizobium sp. AUGA SZCCT0176]|uniref:tail completion protein gp17 n=1 Tax=Bradyrhizobium sp. AUGA SZCCT0176 TaxID=2807664 RepID=UPI001BACF6E8|nr:DUF3168 domain-containing protein [Bradyrhizobium sp. AUGA SZCCT0176]MBR1230206.1 DUF3168 domain-containing protein [Bradyrhizobium sp. AUGA SZCCT0176]
MKDIRPALREFLLGDSNISALVVARVYPIVLPQGQKQASVVYNRVSGGGDYNMQGSTGYAHPRIQIAAWAPTADAAVVLANRVKDRVDGYSGEMGTGANIVRVQGVFQADERELYDDAVQMFGVQRDWFVHYEEL